MKVMITIGIQDMEDYLDYCDNNWIDKLTIQVDVSEEVIDQLLRNNLDDKDNTSALIGIVKGMGE